MKCTDWKDNNAPSGKLEYTYAYQLGKEVVPFTTTRPVLPLGDPNDNYTMTILVRIENQYGTANSYNMSVKVCLCFLQRRQYDISNIIHEHILYCINITIEVGPRYKAAVVSSGNPELHCLLISLFLFFPLSVVRCCLQLLHRLI